MFHRGGSGFPSEANFGRPLNYREGMVRSKLDGCGWRVVIFDSVQPFCEMSVMRVRKAVPRSQFSTESS